ncbi:MAG: transcriptional regulator, partial [Deltaproteobacteria bacterium]|nr:transcriptional regulator [Deltaproteobacteria bacterium]
ACACGGTDAVRRAAQQAGLRPPFPSGRAMIALTIAIAGAPPARVTLTRTLTTIGSAPDAQLRIAGVPAQWLLVQRDGEHAVIAILATNQRITLGDGPIVIDGAVITRAPTEQDPVTLAEAIPVGTIAETLANADDPATALEGFLDLVIASADADTGAIVLVEAGGHTVACARERDGHIVNDGAALLSDTVLQEVLSTGRSVAVDDTAADPRLATVPSVINLRLASVIAIPMLLGDRIAGAIYLGKRRAGRRFGPRLAADLAVVAAMAMPVVAQLRRAGTSRSTGLLGASPVIAALRGLVDRVAPTELAVLITGETGTGKEVVARALHAGSPRALRPLVAVNCAAIPANLFESELFGHKRGAFTGATADRAGRLETADGSTLFLDEVAELPPALQASLLRALQEREIVRVGENVARKVDFRLVCATNRVLEDEVAAGRFRADLLFRLHEVTIELPPLRDRGADIEMLGEFLLAEAEAQLGTARHRLGSDARTALTQHDWPGNVRELRAAMRRAAVLAQGPVITAHDLALPAPRRRPRPANPTPPIGLPPTPAADPIAADRPLAVARDAFVAAYCAAALQRHAGNREAAAAALGISTRSLYRYLLGDTKDE